MKRKQLPGCLGMTTTLLVLICMGLVNASAAIHAWGSARRQAGWDQALQFDTDFDPSDSSLALPADDCGGMPWPTWRFGASDDAGPATYHMSSSADDEPFDCDATVCAADLDACFVFPPMPGEPGCMPADDEYDPLVKVYNVQRSAPASRFFAPPQTQPQDHAPPVMAATQFLVGDAKTPQCLPLTGTTADWLCSLVSSVSLSTDGLGVADAFTTHR